MNGTRKSVSVLPPYYGKNRSISVQLWLPRPNLFFVLLFIDGEAIFHSGRVQEAAPGSYPTAL